MDLSSAAFNTVDLEDRRTFLGASDAKHIMSGNWRYLYRLKTDQDFAITEQAKFADILEVQLGKWTEQFNFRWLIKTSGAFMLSDPMHRLQYQHSDLPWLASMPDGRVELDDLHWLVECKHCNDFTTIEKEVMRYWPQLTHQMLTAEVPRAIFSLLRGNAKHDWVRVELDLQFAEIYQNRAERFWWFVQNNVEPEDDAGGGIAVPKIVGELRTVDMTETNMAGEWKEHADQFLSNKTAAEHFDAAKKQLKQLFPDDAKRAFGAGVEIVRDKAGKCHIRPMLTVIDGAKE